MKGNWLIAALVGVFCLCAVGVAVGAVQYFFQVKAALRAQTEVSRINATLNAAQALANETVEYSKREPGLEALLQSLDLRPKLQASGASTNPANLSQPEITR